MGDKSFLIEKYGKKDCCLCDQAELILKRVEKDYGLNIVAVDIEEDKALYGKYKERIPVIFINGKEEFVFKVSEFALRKRLDQLIKERN